MTTCQFASIVLFFGRAIVQGDPSFVQIVLVQSNTKIVAMGGTGTLEIRYCTAYVHLHPPQESIKKNPPQENTTRSLILLDPASAAAEKSTRDGTFHFSFLQGNAEKQHEGEGVRLRVPTCLVARQPAAPLPPRLPPPLGIHRPRLYKAATAKLNLPSAQIGDSPS